MARGIPTADLQLILQASGQLQNVLGDIRQQKIRSAERKEDVAFREEQAKRHAEAEEQRLGFAREELGIRKQEAGLKALSTFGAGIENVLSLGQKSLDSFLDFKAKSLEELGKARYQAASLNERAQAKVPGVPTEIYVDPASGLLSSRDRSLEDIARSEDAARRFESMKQEEQARFETEAVPTFKPFSAKEQEAIDERLTEAMTAAGFGSWRGTDVQDIAANLPAFEQELQKVTSSIATNLRPSHPDEVRSVVASKFLGKYGDTLDEAIQTASGDAKTNLFEFRNKLQSELKTAGEFGGPPLGVAPKQRRRVVVDLSELEGE